MQSMSFKTAAARSAEQLLTELGSRLTGLTAAERANRLSQNGRNETVSTGNTARAIILRQLRSPFIYLLLAAAFISFLTGDRIEGGMIIMFMAVNTGLGFYQEYRAEQAARLLMKYWQQTVSVLVGGQAARVESRQLVPGDIIQLAAGDKIPADVRFLSAHDLQVDESILTGESIAVTKQATAMSAEPQEYFQATNIGFSGTSLTTGHAEAVVIGTGKNAALGDIVRLATATRSESTFEKEITAFSGVILKLVVVTLAFIFAFNLWLKGIGQIQELLIFAIALTVGIIPEALPIISIIALSRGAAAMAKRHVIVKRLSAINDLGSIDILCTDKTGTITKNIMAVADVNADDREQCLSYALLGAAANGGAASNPFDQALRREFHGTRPAAELIADEPFDPVRRRNSVIVRLTDGSRLLVTRGAPEAIMPLTDSKKDMIEVGRHLERQGLAGNRVLAIAIKRDPATDDVLKEESFGLELVGCVSFHDPLKDDAVAAARKAKQLGVQIKILTGDSKSVAGAIAQQMGLTDDPYAVITGEEFDALDNAAKHTALTTHHVFARLNPAQKFAILGMLQEHNSVGFLGEGFNDAPGLKMANVGLAVQGASDIARESADVILLDKSLLVIFDGIEQGRRVFVNIIKYLKLTLASNFGNFYAIAVVSLFIDFLPMLPVQILLVNLLSDMPMLALAADTVRLEDLKKPKHYSAKDVILTATVLGIVSSIFDFVTFATFRHLEPGNLQTLWFMESVLEELVFLYAARSTVSFFRAARPPFHLIMLSILAAGVAILTPFTRLGAELFRFAPPGLTQTLTVFGIVLVCFITTELVKSWLRKGEARSANHRIKKNNHAV